MAQTFFTISCKTNLHVGSGKANYGVIDQLVQRDPTYQYPAIHASSLKGGVKEYCHHATFGYMKQVFGSDKLSSGKTNHDDSQVGGYKFFDAMLLCIPVRCDKRAFVHVTCPNILDYLDSCLPENHALKNGLVALKNIFDANQKTQAYCFNSDLQDATLEDFDIHATFDSTKAALLTEDIRKLFNCDIAILQNHLFDRLTNDLHLPVIARNYLENGESQNLWYEQVVPRLSRFWSLCIHPDEDVLFNPQLFAENTLVQIGANGSVGYGYCSFTKLS